MTNIIHSIIPTHYVMSIKPKFVERIASGKKHWEFRKSWAVSVPCSKQVVHIYESSPKKKVVGEFEVGAVLRGTPVEIWQAIGEKNAGLSEEEFFEYFKGSERAVAIEICNLRWYGINQQFGVWMYGMKRPPQSYALINVPQKEIK